MVYGFLDRRGLITPVTKFCEERRMGKNLTDAFSAYCRSSLAARFELSREGDTITSLVLRMTEDDVEKLWKRFILDLKDTLV